MENLEQQAEVQIPQPEQPARKKRRKRRKRSSSRRPRLLQLPSAAAVSPDSNSGDIADQSPQPAIPEKFEQACQEVLSDLPAEENRIVPAEEPGEPNPQFEKMARIYLSKPFAMLAYFLEDDEIKLDDDQMSILVPEAAQSLEEIWPYLPEWFKNSRFKHTYAFAFTFGMIAGENCLRVYRKCKNKLDTPAKPDPHVAPSSTSMEDSPASRVMLPNLAGAKLI